MDLAGEDGLSFGQLHVGSAQLGDRRRTARLVAVADQLLCPPQGTFPQKIPAPYDLDAFSRLVAAADVTHAAVLAPQCRLPHRRMAEHDGVTLLLQDSTVLDYSGLSILERGQVGDGHGRGYYCHNCRAVTADRRVLGLAHQILHPRRDVPVGETREQRRQHPQRESRLWRDTAAALPAAPAGRVWVDGADCAAALTEFLDFEEEQPRPYGVRSQHNRWVRVVQGAGRQRRKLWDVARALPAGPPTREVTVAAREGQPARTARVRVAWGAVTLVPPRQRRGRERGGPLAVWVLRGAESEPPPGVEPLEWILLTNVAVATVAAAWERADWYSCRVVGEAYHTCQKTGCDIERMQFEYAARLEPAIALVSVVALTLLQLRAWARQPEHKSQAATAWLPPLWVRLLAQWRYGPGRTHLTVEEFVLALGRWGGHQNRPRDGLPGWQTWWRGWMQLQAMVQGVLLLNSETCGGT
jgi:transposase-like protein